MGLVVMFASTSGLSGAMSHSLYFSFPFLAARMKVLVGKFQPYLYGNYVSLFFPSIWICDLDGVM